MTLFDELIIRKHTFIGDKQSNYFYYDTKGRVDPDDIIGITNECKHDISCSICTFVYNYSIMLDCGHIFCVDCVKYFKNNKCPLCRAKIINVNNIRDFDKLVNDKIKNLLMDCIDCNTKHTVENNCVKKTCNIKRCKFCNFQVDNIFEHFTNDCINISKCKYDICNKFTYKNKIYEHELICGHRFIQCETCNDKIKVKNIKKHKKKCIQIKNCELCNKRIHIKNMDNHLTKKCSKRKIKCNICSKIMPSYKFSHHRKKCNKFFHYFNYYEIV
jgi:hypothetical protein